MNVKSALKTIAEIVALLVMLPAVAVYYLLALLAGRERAFPFWSQATSLVPGFCGIYLRRAFYRCVLPRVESGVCITFGTVLSHPTAEFGRNVYTGAFCVLGDVTLEDDVLLGSHVSIINGSRQHGIDRLDIPVREQPGEYPRVTIGCDTWIGDRSVVQANVGRHCVIGSGSVVTRPIPDFAVAAGVPAKVLRFRDGREDFSGANADLPAEPAPGVASQETR